MEKLCLNKKVAIIIKLKNTVFKWGDCISFVISDEFLKLLTGVK